MFDDEEDDDSDSELVPQTKEDYLQLWLEEGVVNVLKQQYYRVQFLAKVGQIANFANLVYTCK